MVTLIFLTGLCGYVWVNTLSLSPEGFERSVACEMRGRDWLKWSTYRTETVPSTFEHVGVLMSDNDSLYIHCERNESNMPYLLLNSPGESHENPHIMNTAPDTWSLLTTEGGMEK